MPPIDQHTHRRYVRQELLAMQRHGRNIGNLDQQSAAWRLADRVTMRYEGMTTEQIDAQFVRESDPPELPDFPSFPVGPIYSDFLSRGYMTLLIPAYPVPTQVERFQELAGAGLTDVDLYAHNDRDNPYHEPYWRVQDVALARDAALRASEAGLRVTLWCFADELSISYDQALAKLPRIVRACDGAVERYVVALEGNESFRSDTELRTLHHALRDLTGKKIYTHLTRGLNFGTSYETDGIYYQYMARTPGAVVSESETMRRKWHDVGKQFIAGEFPFDVVKDNPAMARKLGMAVAPFVDGRANG